jgi:hypothetical protein
VHHALTIVCVDDSDGVGDVQCLRIVCMCVRNTNAVCRYGLFGCLLQGSCDLLLPLTIVNTERAADTVHYNVKVEPRFCLHVDYMLCRLARTVHALFYSVTLLDRNTSKSPGTYSRHGMTIITVHVCCTNSKHQSRQDGNFDRGQCCSIELISSP